MPAIKGTASISDSRAATRALKSTKFPQHFAQPVDVSRVHRDIIHQWIEDRVTRALGFEDEIVASTALNLFVPEDLSGGGGSTEPVDPRQAQIALEGFLGKETASFCSDLWQLLLEAQDSPQGVPKSIVEAKQRELEEEKKKQQQLLEEQQRRAPPPPPPRLPPLHRPPPHVDQRFDPQRPPPFPPNRNDFRNNNLQRRSVSPLPPPPPPQHQHQHQQSRRYGEWQDVRGRGRPPSPREDRYPPPSSKEDDGTDEFGRRRVPLPVARRPPDDDSGPRRGIAASAQDNRRPFEQKGSILGLPPMDDRRRRDHDDKEPRTDTFGRSRGRGGSPSLNDQKTSWEDRQRRPKPEFGARRPPSPRERNDRHHRSHHRQSVPADDRLPRHHRHLPRYRDDALPESEDAARDRDRRSRPARSPSPLPPRRRSLSPTSSSSRSMSSRSRSRSPPSRRPRGGSRPRRRRRSRSSSPSRSPSRSSRSHSSESRSLYSSRSSGSSRRSGSRRGRGRSPSPPPRVVRRGRLSRSPRTRTRRSRSHSGSSTASEGRPPPRSSKKSRV